MQKVTQKFKNLKEIVHEECCNESVCKFSANYVENSGLEKELKKVVTRTRTRSRTISQTRLHPFSTSHRIDSIGNFDTRFSVTYFGWQLCNVYQNSLRNMPAGNREVTFELAENLQLLRRLYRTRLAAPKSGGGAAPTVAVAGYTTIF